MIKIGVLGGSGRMGALIIQKILDSPLAQLAAVGIHQRVNSHLSTLKVPVTTQTEKVFAVSDVVIDFTKPEALIGHLEIAARTLRPMVIGTTGLIDQDYMHMQNTSAHVPIVYAPNMSLGLTLMTRVVEQVSSLLDDSFDVEILEMHHRHKTDAPSGTALTLGRAAAEGRSLPFATHACFDRTHRNSGRPRSEIGFAVLRGGNIYGDHQVMFTSDEEMLTLSHRALNPTVFAKGAVKAALWVEQKDQGVYTMQDVLGI